MKKGKNTMKFFNQKTLFFSLGWLCIILLSSCAQTPPFEEEIHILVSPHKLSVCSGSEDKVFVKLLDKQGGALFGVEVKAVSTSPTAATVTPAALTDATGKAMFTVTGISPGATNIIFSIVGHKASMEVIYIGH